MNAGSRACLGEYDFERIAAHARRRYVEGVETVELIRRARSQREREEIVLVCMLDIEDDQVRYLDLCCRHASRCRVYDCRRRLRALIEADLQAHRAR